MGFPSIRRNVEPRHVRHFPFLNASLLVWVLLMGTVVAWSSSPRYAYVANADDNTISVYTVDPVSGQLRAHGYAISEGGPNHVAVLMDKFVYVANSSSNTLTSFSINGNGTLRKTGVLGTRSAPATIATHPSNNFIYVTNSGSASISGYIVNATNGTLTPMGGSPFDTGVSPRGLIVSSNGAFLYAANSSSNTISAFKIDALTGALTSIGNFTSGTSPRSLVVDKTGVFLYVANFSGDVTAFRISSTGTLTLLHSYFVGGNPRSVVIDLSGKFLYVGSDGTNQVSGFAINSSTGTLSALSPAAIPAQVTGVRDLEISQSNAFLYVVGTFSRAVSAFRIATDGNLTSIPRDKVRTHGQATSIAISGGTSPLIFSSKFVYATADEASCCAHNLGHIHAYALGSTGALQLLSITAVDVNPTSMTIDPFNRFVYTGNQADELGGGTNSIAGFLVNGSTGALTKIAGSPVLTGGAPDSIAIDPSGRFLFALFGASKALVTYGVSSSGVLSKLSTVTAAGVGRLAVDPIGTFVYVSSGSSTTTFKINPKSGVLVATRMIPVTGIPTIDPSGKFLFLGLLSQPTTNTYIINSGTGSLSLLSVSDTVWRPTANHPSGRFIYAAEQHSGNTVGIFGFTTGATSGKLTLIPGSPFSDAPLMNQGQDAPAAAVDFSGKFVIGVWVSDGEFVGGLAVFSISNTTGALTLGQVITGGPSGVRALISATRNLH
jgi:6-phosphogluconolactonase (cycloisomerase 2 family)